MCYKALLQYYSVLQSTTQYYSVVQRTTPVLFRTTKYYSSTTKYYSSTTLYYKVILQYYSVLQSTTQYYSVLQSTTPVLFRSTKILLQYYTLHYKVLLQYFSALESTTPVLLCTTKYNSSTTLYYKATLSIDPRYIWNDIYNARSNKVILQPHQILRLPRKMILMINPFHTWNAIDIARSNRCHCPTSPNTAPATKNDSHDQSSSHMKRYWLPMGGATGVIVQPHRMLRLPRKGTLMTASWLILVTDETLWQCAEQQVSLSNLTKYCACHEKWASKMWGKFDENRWNVIYNARPIRDRSENDPTMKPSVRNPRRNRGYFSRSSRAFCIEKYNISRSGYHSKFHRILRLPRKMTVQLQQILRLPRKMTLMINPLHTWNAIYNARSNTSHPPTSRNTAPATKSHPHHWSLAYETRFTMRGATSVMVEPHQILRLSRKMTVQNVREICWKETKRHLQGAADPSMIRDRSENETVSPQPASRPRLLFALTTSIWYWKIQHFALRLSFQISRETVPATKSDTATSPLKIKTAPATKNDNSTSPNSAPATKSDYDSITTFLTMILLLLDDFYYLTMLLLDDAITGRFYCFTMLLLDDAITLRCYYLTMLLLDDAIT